MAMHLSKLAAEIVSHYERHGWKLRRVLVRPDKRAEVDQHEFREATIVESDFDALWFARSSTNKREAWELRLLSEQPYALFEAFEVDESEEDREDARREMENRMREHAHR